MQDAVSKAKPTIHRATYDLVRQILAQMEPLSNLANGADNPDQPDPIDVMITLLEQVVGGIERLHSRLENLESRLDDPAVARAIKSAARG